jgi:hypothetical protein
MRVRSAVARVAVRLLKLRERPVYGARRGWAEPFAPGLYLCLHENIGWCILRRVDGDVEWRDADGTGWHNWKMIDRAYRLPSVR